MAVARTQAVVDGSAELTFRPKLCAPPSFLHYTDAYLIHSDSNDTFERLNAEAVLKEKMLEEKRLQMTKGI